MHTPADTDTLIRQLTHHDMNTRYRAETQLRRLGTDAVPSLMRAMEAEWKRYRYRELFALKATKISLVASVMFIFCGFLLLPFGIHLTSALIIVISCLLINIPLLMIQADSSRMPRRLKLIYELLLERSDARMLGRILEMVSTEKAWLTHQALMTLTQHLPQITAQDWEHLTPKQRRTFYELVEQQGQLKFKECSDFTHAALKALEQFGDAEAIPAVERVATHGKSRVLNERAQECLAYLHIRRDEQSVRQTLLRASQSNGNSKNELLRIPTHVPDTASEQLLRVPQEE